jgi:TonB family protein
MQSFTRKLTAATALILSTSCALALAEDLDDAELYSYAAIERAVGEYKDEIRFCYERELAPEAEPIRGSVVVAFTVIEDGSVAHAAVSSSTLENANIEACLVNVVRRIDSFPAPKQGRADWSYPFKFDSN